MTAAYQRFISLHSHQLNIDNGFKIFNILKPANFDGVDSPLSKKMVDCLRLYIVDAKSEELKQRITRYVRIVVDSDIMTDQEHLDVLQQYIS